MSLTVDLVIRKGNTFSRVFRLLKPDGTRLSVSGATFVFRAVDGSTELLRYASADADKLVVSSPSEGEITLTIPVADTRLLPDGAIARYELELRSGGTQTTVADGRLNVSSWANDDA